MADELATAIVEIEPDLSRFEDLLKRQLESTISKIEKSAAAKVEITLQVDNSSKALEKSLRQSLVISDQINANFDSLSKTFQSMDAATRKISENTKNIAKGGTAGEQALNGQLSKMQRIVFLAGNLSEIFANATKVYEFVKILQGINREFVFLGKQTTKVADAVRGFFAAFKGEGSGATKEMGAIQRALQKGLETREKTDKKGVPIPGTSKSLAEAAMDTRKGAGDFKIIQTEAQKLARTTTEAAKAGTNLGVGLKKLGRSFIDLVTPNTAANATLQSTVPLVTALTNKLSGPGTAALTEFGSKGQGIFSRLSTGLQQSSQNMRFHLSKLTESFNKTFFIGPISHFFNNIGAVFSAGASSIDFIKDKVGQGKKAFDGLKTAMGTPLQTAIGAVVSKLATLSPATLGVGAIFATTLAVKGLTKVIIGLAQKASMLQESVNAVKVLLGPEANASFKEMIGDVTKLGITQLELNESIAPIVPLLKDAGLGGEELAGKLNDLTRRAVDLGSIFNKTSGDVLVKLGAAIRGEIEPARALGISFNAVAVDAVAMANGAEKVEGQFSEEAKTLARLQLVMEKSKDSAGDFANTQDSLANATRSYKSVINTLKFSFSEVFLKASEKITAAMNKLASTIGPGLEKMFISLTPLMNEFGEKLSDMFIGGAAQQVAEAFIAAMTTFTPILDVAVDSLQALLQVTEVFNAVLGKFLPGNISLLTVLFTQFLIGKQVAAVLGTVTIAVRALSIAVGALGATSAAASMKMFAGSLTALAGPIGIAVTALVIFGRQARETSEVLKSLTGAPSADLLGEFAKGLKDTTGIDDAGKFLVGALRAGPFGQVEAETKEFSRRVKELFAETFAASPELASQLVTQAEIANLEVAPLLRTELKRLNEEQARRNELLEAALPLVERMAKAEKVFADGFNTSKTALEGLLTASAAEVSANKSLTSANNSLASATKAVRDIEVERAKILRDTISPLQEMVDAQEALTRAGYRLRDLGQEQLEIEQQLIDLRAPATADELAAADRAVERAKIALNKAIREEAEGLKELNKEEAVSVDLTGLSLEQIRSKLAAVRATLANQRAAKKDEDKGKTQEEIDEGQLENKLSVLDSAQALKDTEEERQAIQDRQLLNLPQVQELEERLLDLGLDRADAIVDQEGAEKRLVELKRGETTLSQTLAALEERKKAALEAQKTAQEAVTTAKDALRIATLEQDAAEARIENNTRLVLETEAKILAEKVKQAGLDKGTEESLLRRIDLLKVQAAIPLPAVDSPVPVQKTGVEHLVTSGLLGGGLAEAAIEALTAAILKTQALKSFLTPGGARALMAGGVVEGVSGATGTLVRLGEHSYSELVLPYQRDPRRSASLLSQFAPEVLGIANNAALKGVRLSASQATPLPMVRSGQVARNKPSKVEKYLERLIALQEASNSKTYEVNAPINIATTDPELAARRAAKEIIRKLANA